MNASDTMQAVPEISVLTNGITTWILRSSAQFSRFRGLRKARLYRFLLRRMMWDRRDLRAELSAYLRTALS